MSVRVSRTRRLRRPAASLAGVPVGGGALVVVMGVLNASPESFYAGSVQTTTEGLREAASAMIAAGAGLLDVGARSTAPYRLDEVGEEEETRRLAAAVRALVPLGVPVSADTTRPGPAAAALAAGAVIINDVTGLADVEMGRLVAAGDAAVVLAASPAAARAAAVDIDVDDPVGTVRASLAASLARAGAAGIPHDRIVLDPGIGFFLEEPEARAIWDTRVLVGLRRLEELGCPLAIGVSRKSFIGSLTGRVRPEDRLAGSLAATALAVAGGAAVVRTHDVAATVDAARVAERLGRVQPEVVAPERRRRHEDRSAS